MEYMYKDNKTSYISMKMYNTSLREGVLKMKKIQIGCRKFTVRETFARKPICTKCLNTGHLIRVCRATDRRCGRCSEAGHGISDCKKRFPTCYNCGGSHNAFARSCPARKKAGDSGKTTPSQKVNPFTVKKKLNKKLEEMGKRAL
jgi:hypothetical protein